MNYVSYKDWIARFQIVERPCPLADLAIDVCEDDDFPDSDNKYDILEYLRRSGACEAALQTFDDTWIMYQRVKDTYNESALREINCMAG